MNLKDYSQSRPVNITALQQNQQQTRSRLEKILNQVTTASHIVSQHRNVLTKGAEQKEPNSDRSIQHDTAPQSPKQQSKVGPTTRQLSPPVPEPAVTRSDVLSPVRFQTSRNRTSSKLQLKPPVIRSEGTRFQAWQQTLNNLQSRVLQARVELGKHISQRNIEAPPERSTKQVEKVVEEREQDMANTKTVVKVASMRSLPRQKLSSYVTTYYIPELIRSINERHSTAMQHVRESIGIFKFFTGFKRREQFIPKKLELPQSQRYRGKKTLVFDLDETLIHYSENGGKHYDISLSIIMPTGQTVQAHVSIRPYAITLLNKLIDKFQLMVFTASDKTYANTVINFLDPDSRIFQHRLYKQHCYQHPEGPVKDLQVVNRLPESIVLIDNSPYSYGFQQDSAIPILPFYGEDNDSELKRLQQYLGRLDQASDVRELNRQTFQLHRYGSYSQAKSLVSELYMKAN